MRCVLVAVAACSVPATASPSQPARIPASSVQLTFSRSGPLVGNLIGIAECDHAPTGLAVAATGTVGSGGAPVSVYVATPVTGISAAYTIYGRNGETTVWIVTGDSTTYATTGTVGISTTGVTIHVRFDPTSGFTALDGSVSCDLGRGQPTTKVHREAGPLAGAGKLRR